VLDAWPLLALAATSFALGARHGLDWDHIAAITDLTSPRKGDEDAPAQHGKRGLGLAWPTASATASCSPCSPG
jgi:hypothetical protein